MINGLKFILAGMLASITGLASLAQQQQVQLVKTTEGKVDILVGKKIFTSFLYPDSLEKPVLFPVNAANGTAVTRGFPLQPVAGDANDHPHHIGIWFNFENVNGLDFWNNSYAIPKEKKQQYGWIKTDTVTTADGPTGTLTYHANWTNQANTVLLEENTRYQFSGNEQERTIDRLTVLRADTTVLFADAKDGMFAIRLAHALQIPTSKDQKFTDDKGNVEVVKGGSDKVANGNYFSSEGKEGDSVWSSRARWCKVFGRIGADSVTVVIFDHPSNPNYPTYWHARGYGLFAANPLGEKIFTNGARARNLQLEKGDSVTFRYRVFVHDGRFTPSVAQLDAIAADFAKTK
jgi:hypothetical protein